MGLSTGDIITEMEWDALQSVGGDGAFFRTVLGAKGGVFSDGRINSVDVTNGGSPSTIVQSDVDLHFDLDLLSQALGGGPTVFNSTASFGGSAAITPDFLIKENGVNILFGNVTLNFTVSGNINVADNSPQQLTGIARITLTGGDSALLASLGGPGGQANLVLSASVFGFNPPLNQLASDGNIFNSDFNMSLTGTLVPLNASAFVPEPSTALLVSTGLLGLMAFSRRARVKGRDKETTTPH